MLAEEKSIDARHTIDRTRRWIELSTAPQRQALDQTLVAHPQIWTGPFELTSTLLTLLRLLHADRGPGFKEVLRVAHLLVESLESAAKKVVDDSQSRIYAIELLGILVDAFAELGWNDAVAVIEMRLTIRVVQLVVDLVWRDEQGVKIAAGIIDRVGARGGTFAFVVVANIASTIVAKLAHLADNLHAAVHAEDPEPLVSITSVFRVCLDVMLEICFENAKASIQNALHKPLSSLLDRMLERTIDDPSDERAAELDCVVTKLYDLCDRELDAMSRSI